MKSSGVHIPNSLFHYFPLNSSAKKGPWHWDKSTTTNEGADALLLFWKERHSCHWAEETDMPSRWSPLNGPAGFHTRGPRKAARAPCRARGLAGHGQASLSSAAPDGFRKSELPLVTERICALALALTFLGNEWRQRSTSTAPPTVGLAGEGLPNPGGTAPKPPQASSYLAEPGITPEHLQPITFIPVDFACTEVLRSDTLMLREGND